MVTVAGENLLRSAKTIAVVGLSSRRSRPSYGVSEYMQSKGYRIIPVNPNETEVLGEKAWSSLDEVPEQVDIVDVFRRSECVPDIVDAAIRIGARGVWLQEGVVHEASHRLQCFGKNRGDQVYRRETYSTAFSEERSNG